MVNISQTEISTASRSLLILLSVCLLAYFKSPAVAFLLGAAIALIINGPLVAGIDKLGVYSLQAAIVLLGLKLNAGQVMAITADYSLMVAAYVILTMGVGLLLGRILRTGKKSAQLISSGAAICGGTAVATLSPVIGAKAEHTGTALTLIFLLNAFALMTFPSIGAYLEMSQEQFGVWVALSVHDTSSVVATSTVFGEEAAKIATFVKLGRTLWLVPLVFIFSILQSKGRAKIHIPMFIILFLAAASMNPFLELPDQILVIANIVSSTLLMVALFCIGSGINRETLLNLKGAPVIHTLLLWALIVPATLLMVLNFV
ncbi:MAG: putative sulfate exporter family transporter [Porticoccaceae bacterium]|nr:putative sulfate exporter family transporter [Porticoccaceae bacterium]